MSDNIERALKQIRDDAVELAHGVRTDAGDRLRDERHGLVPTAAFLASTAAAFTSLARELSDLADNLLLGRPLDVRQTDADRRKD